MPAASLPLAAPPDRDDTDQRTAILTSRVTGETKRLALAAATLNGVSVSAFISVAVAEIARERLGAA